MPDEGVSAVAEHCARMRLLAVSSCESVTDEGVSAVAEHYAGLQHLDPHWCVGVTDEGVSAVAEHCAGLQHLDVSPGYSQIRLILNLIYRLPQFVQSDLI